MPRGSPKTASRKRTRSRHVAVLASTRKGAWIFHADPKRKSWRTEGPHFLGQIIHHLMIDPRDGRTLLAAASAGHLGPTIFRSTNGGKSWKEAKRPPAFPKASEGQPGRSVKHTFWLTPGHADEANTWYGGTCPQGLFRSEDGGDTWEPVAGINDNPAFVSFIRDVQGGTPDGPTLHSINVDPRDRNHLYIGMSSGGVHESLDGGRTWTALVNGMEVVEGFDVTNVGFHDPHCVRICPSNPDRLYQQNHCGIYRLDRPGTTWTRIGRAMPAKVGDIGFPMVVHPRDAATAWVFPMDGSGVWPRTSPGGVPSAFVTHDAGKSWRRSNAGFPKGQAWWTVKRQAMTADALDVVGLYLGNTGGEVWMSGDEGRRWSCIARHLPEIYALETAELP
jgi:photosystem II stability/assembly factor-like uncharacterized protein